MRSAPSLLVAAAVAACSPKSTGSEAVPQGTAADATAEISQGLTGTVLEQIPASPYVYLRLKTADGEVWAAVSEAPVENGAEVTIAAPMLMSNFESSSLKRTFEQIYFGELAGSGGAAAVGTAAAGGNPHAGVGQAAQVQVGKVDKASGADARTVAELWAGKDGLEGKTATVRGVVVKANNGVMGKNWIHLQDGSGDAAQGTNDLTVTTQGTAAKGETVTIKGTVRTNKDFGAGYTYAVIVEDATIVK